MNAKISYYSPHTKIIVCELSGAWSWTAMYEVYRQIEVFAAPHARPYSIIFDVKGISSFSSRDFFSQARHMVTHLEPGFSGSIVLLNAGDLMRTLITAVRTVQPRLFRNTRFMFAPTIDEAARMLAEPTSH